MIQVCRIAQALKQASHVRRSPFLVAVIRGVSFTLHGTGSVPLFRASWCSTTTSEEVNLLLKSYGSFYNKQCECNKKSS